MQRCLLVLSFLLLPFVVKCQKVRLVSATSQRWFGGVAGMHGNRYFFVIRFIGFKQTPTPDTLWVDKKAIPLAQPTNSATLATHPNMKGERNGDTITYTINVNYAYNDYDKINSFGDQKVQTKDYPIHYTGAAVIGYTVNLTSKFFKVKTIDQLPDVNYP